VLALASDYAKSIEIAPVWDIPGVYDIRPKGYVGTVSLPDAELLIGPKGDMNTAMFMVASVEAGVLLRQDMVALPEESLTSFVSRCFVQLVRPLVERRLRRRYVPHAEESSFVRGRIDVAGSMLLLSRATPALVCEFDDFTPDITENQTLLAAAHVLLAHPSSANAVMRELRRIVAMLGEVQLRVPATWERKAIVLDRLGAAYRDPLEIAEWILAHVSPEFTSRDVARGFRAFLLDMAPVFERYVFQELAKRMATVGLTALSKPAQKLDSQMLYTTEPDILVRNREGECLILDTKYKVLDRAPGEDDLYQMITYCVSRGAKHGILVYPGFAESKDLRTTIERAGVTIQAVTVDVRGGSAALAESLDTLAESTRSLLPEH
jgi:5-methylcytosine-specific restriction enzyme subunit McrC